MKIIKKLKGKEAKEFYQKEFQTPPSKEMDYIEVREISGFPDLSTYFVYYKESKEKAA